ncbi:alpha/beta hydrolase [Saccharomonospora piscinae]|uniref:alpha/beta hydrolase n=1 Tax=Saccharomonospora piscinae TaxID=687388 RepID=UPI00110618F7|nr:alpha/beta hydrolase [Saccharomonospora piscinae]TLW92089.1 alpha/beta hydrolase [Saccharomonospora piscinae]
MRKPVLALVAAAVVAPLTPVVASAATASSSTLRWGECPADVARPGLECSTLDVPLDYRDPGGETIEIAVSRLASADPDERRGVLFTNTGGPGGAGLEFPAILRDDLSVPEAVLDKYDIIGIDPRGVAHSTPVTCDLTLAEHPTNIPLFARNPADVADEAERVAAVAEKCGSSETASLLPHVTTANTARDMDRVREALGEETVSYFGISYGTYLGSVYTSMFPERSDRFLLDSATGPHGWDHSHSRMLGRGVEDRFPDFAAFAAARPEYGLGETPRQVRKKYFEIAAKLDAEPRPDGYDGQAFRHVTFANLYFDRNLPALAETWRALDTGEPVPASAGTKDQAAPASGIPSDNYVASQLHVICNDSDWPENVWTYQFHVAVDRLRHPMFGAAGANITPCAFWPSEPAEPQVDITDEGPANVLIVQNRRDPATPLAGARQLREAFGDRARMVTADQGGHLAYLQLDNQCLNDLATDFLVTGERPNRDVACEAEPA